mgnify:FL=1
MASRVRLSNNGLLTVEETLREIRGLVFLLPDEHSLLRVVGYLCEYVDCDVMIDYLKEYKGDDY